MVVGVVNLNVLLLIPMCSWRILPAAICNTFINIPWVAAKCADESAYSTDYVRLRSCHAAWVMEVLYSFATLAFNYAIGGKSDNELRHQGCTVCMV